MLSFAMVALVIINKHPITGSELSIYGSLSPQVLLFLIAPVLVGIGIIIYGVHQNQNIWLIGLLLILYSNLILVLLPYLKGYYFSDGMDNIFHLGYIRDIINTGHFGIDNTYPAVHIFTTELSAVLALSPDFVINIIGPMFYILFVLFTFMCAKEIMPIQAAILAATASTVLSCYYYTEIFPYGFALIMFPFIFFLYFRYLKTNTVGIAILLIIMIALIAIFHPVASLSLTIALLLLEFGKWIFRKFYGKQREKSYQHSHQGERINLTFPTISFCFLAIWTWVHPNLWNAAAENVKDLFTGTVVVQPLVTFAQENLNKLGLGISGELLLLVRLYGTTFIYLGLSLIAIIIIFKKIVITEYDNLMKMFIYSIAFFPFVIIWLIDYVKPLTTLSSGRLIYAATLFFPLLAGLTLYKLGKPLTNNNQRNNVNPIFRMAGNIVPSIIVLLILAVCSVQTIFSLYPSPSIYQPFPGISHAYFQGEAWLVQNGNPNTRVLNLYTTSPESIASAIWGTEPKIYPETNPLTIPFHFGYASNQTLGQSFKGDTYLFLISSNKLLYTNIWPQVGRLTLNDFTKLEEDPSVDSIYSNGEAQDYYIHSHS